MKKIFCDNHPDRPADYTLSIKVLPLGSRPIFTFMDDRSKARIVDLCAECASTTLPRRD